jgi:hypothetical protein
VEVNKYVKTRTRSTCRRPKFNNKQPEYFNQKKKRREYKNLDDWLNAIVRGYNEMKIIKIYI